MSIAETLSWEIVAQNDRGEATARQRIALEVAYGVSIKVADPELFKAIMESVIEQVSDKELQRLMRLYTTRGLKQ